MTANESTIEHVARKLNDVACIYAVRAENAAHAAHEAATQGRDVLDAALRDASGVGHEVWLDASALYDRQVRALGELVDVNRQIRTHILGYVATLGLSAASSLEQSRVTDSGPSYGLHEDLIG